MSSIDERVVKISFNNSNFQSKVMESLTAIKMLNSGIVQFSKTISTLDKWGNVASKFVKANQSMSQSLNTIDLQGMSTAVDTVNTRFSTMGIIGARVLQNLTDKAMAFAGSLYSITLGQIKSGGISRAMNIENARFMVDGLNDAEATWDKLYEDINYGVQDTAYGLDAAAKVAAQLVASGIKAGDQMKSTLRGISGVAAMSNSSYEDIGQIYSTVASNGKLMTEQVRQFSYRGMNASATLAKYLTKVGDGAEVTEAQVNEMVTNGKIDFATFAAAMDDAFGEHAKDANKTFNGVLMNIKAALSKIGADFVSPLIVQEGPLVQFLNSVKDKVNDFRNALSTRDENGNLLGGFAKDATDALNSTLTKLSTALSNMDFTNAFSGIVNIFYSIWNVLKGVLSVLSPIQKAFKDILPDNLSESFLNFTERLRETTSKMEISKKTAKKLHDAFYAFFNFIRTTASGSFGILKALFDNLNNTMGKGASRIASSGLSLITQAFNFLAKAITKTNEALEPVKKSLGSVMETLGKDVLKTVTNASASLGVIFSAGILKNIKSFTDLLSNPKKTFIAPITKTLNSINKTMQNYQSTINAQKITAIAKAMVIMAGALFIFAESLVVMTSVSPDKLAASAGALLALFAAFSKISKDKTPVKFKDALTSFVSSKSISTVKNLIAVSATLYILAKVVQQLSALSWDELKRGIAGATVLIVMLTALLKIMTVSDKSSAKKIKGLFSLIAFATAVRILVSSVKQLADMDTKNLIQGLAGVSILVTELVAVATLLGLKKGSLLVDRAKKNAIALVIFAIALKSVVKSVSEIGSMSTESVIQGLAGVSILVTELVAVATLLGLKKGSLLVDRAKKNAIALVIFAIALKSVVKSVSEIGSMSTESVIQGLAGVSIIIAELAGVMVGLSAFSKMSIKNVVNILSMLPLIASTIKGISAVVTTLGNLSIENLTKGLFGLSVSLFIFITALTALSSLGGSLLIVSASMMQFGLALMFVGGAIALAGTGFFMIVSALNALKRTSVQIIDSLSETLTALAKNLPGIQEALTKVLTGLLETIFNLIPTIVKGLLTAITETLKALRDSIGDIANMLFDILVTVISVLVTRIPELTEPLSNFVAAVIDLLAKVFSKISEKVDFKTLVSVVAQMTAICLGMAAIKTFGVAAMKGVLFFGAIVAELTLVMEALGFLFSGDISLNLIEKAGNVLGKLGTSIGKFLGGIVGGGLSSASDSLPSVGQNLSKFMKNAKPFFEGLSVIDDSTMKAAKDLVKIFVTLTANDLLAGDFGIFGSINKFVDQKLGTGTMTDFASQLEDFGKAMKKFAKATEGINPESVKVISNTLPKIVSAVKKANNTKIDTDNIGAFESALPSVARGIKMFSNVIGTDSLNVDNMNSATTVASSVADLAKTISGIKGLKKGSNSNSFTAFTSMLPTFANDIRSYSNAIGTDALNIDNMNNATSVASSVATLVETVTGIKGLSKSVDGGKFTAFTAMLPNFATDIRNFSNAIGTDALNLDNMNNSVSVASSVATLADTVTGIKGLKKSVNGGSFTAFTSMLPTFASHIRSFSDTIGSDGLNIDNMNNAVGVLPTLADVASTISSIKNFSGAGKNAGNFSSFISQLPTLGTNINAFAASVSGFADLQASATAAVDLIKYLLEAFSNTQTANTEAISSLATGLTDLANSNIQGFVDAFSNAGESVKGAVTGLLDSAVSAMNGYKDKFKEVGSALSKNFVSGIKAHKDSAEKQGEELAKSAKSGARSKYQGFYNAGAYLVEGFCAGISENSFKAEAQASAMAKAAKEAAEKALDEHSPSKEMYKVGNFFVAGFSNAITENTKTAVTSAFNMAKNVMATVSGTLNTSQLDSGLALTPVLDTSNIKSYSWSGIINGQLGDLSFTEQTQSMIDVCREIQNGIIDSNNKVISAINALRDDMGLYYSDANAEVSLYLDQTKLGSAISKNFTRQMSALNKLK